MATLAEIEAQKQVGLAQVDMAIDNAAEQRNAAMSDDEVLKCNAALARLRSRRTRFLIQIYERERNSEEMAQALAQLRAATAKMTEVAARMTSVTAVIDQINDFLGAVDGAIGALRR